MQENILDPNPEADLVVYAIWFNMLVMDHRSRWDDGLLTDDRVIHFWDEPREVGRWYAEQGIYPFGTVAWDIFFLYGPEAGWDEVPAPLLSSGFTIIAQRSKLADAIAPFMQ